tara:strand:+ start:251 stop:472 length:222 start_codon:yes stop_codon:yes gene_type:complete
MTLRSLFRSKILIKNSHIAYAIWERKNKKKENPSKEGSIFPRSELEGGLHKTAKVVEAVVTAFATEGTVTTIS